MLAPAELLDCIKQIEVDMGRQPAKKWGPRLIDIDILFYDDWVVDEPGLQIPHPHLNERAFVLQPLSDIAPQLRHPLTGQSVSEHLSAVDGGGVHLLAERIQ